MWTYTPGNLRVYKVGLLPGKVSGYVLDDMLNAIYYT
jgi:hypothetical protein